LRRRRAEIAWERMEEGVVFAERNQRSAEGQGQKAAR
jgi:hypothetical protein